MRLLRDETLEYRIIMKGIMKKKKLNITKPPKDFIKW